MCNLKEINDAFKILKNKKRKIILLHCNTEYPTPLKDINMKAMLTLKEKFKVNVGYSDHSLGTEVPIVATALGAKVIEKHFTISKNMNGPDHASSLNPKELIHMVKVIRKTEIILGNSKKLVTKSEKKNKFIARKSLFALNDIEINEKFSTKNLVCLRPGYGISPMKISNIYGKKSKKFYSKGQMIKF